MASSGNFCTWTPLLGIKDDGSSGITFSNGNTTATQTHNGIATTGTHAVSSGKFYWEIYYSASSDFSDGHLLAGWQSLRYNVDYAYTRQQPGSGQGAPDRNVWGSHLMNYKGAGTSAFQGGYLSAGNDVNNDTYDGAYNLGLRVGSAKTLQFAGDFDNHKLYFGVDNTWYSLANSGTGGSAANTDSGSFNTSYGWSIETAWQGYQWTPACWFSGAASGTVATINAGQDSTFAGRLSAGGNADANGFGDFRYAPPSGFLALCSANLPISADIDPAQTDDDYPQKQFNTITYTGIGGTSANNVTGVGFQPDLIWISNREQNASFTNTLVDSSRGRSKVLYSQRTDAEATSSTNRDISSINSDGFTIQDTSNIDGNQSGIGYVAWCWKANGGVTSSNTDGSITSTVQANTKGGFSIVTTSGTGSNGTIGHGLGAVPKLIFTKRRSGSTSWVTYHPNQGSGGTGGELGYMHLDATQAFSDLNTIWNDTAPTSDVFSVGTATNVNASGSTYVHYCWAEIEGYSKFGSYVGNYNTDGTFIYTGFRPRMLFVKRSDATNSWFVWDTARTTFNKMNSYLYWDLSNAEETGYAIDVLSNGFKLRGQNNATNNSGGTFVYGAWGDVPFKYNNTF
jgi:hypothetical protein